PDARALYECRQRGRKRNRAHATRPRLYDTGGARRKWNDRSPAGIAFDPGAGNGGRASGGYTGARPAVHRRVRCTWSEPRLVRRVLRQYGKSCAPCIRRVVSFTFTLCRKCFPDRVRGDRGRALRKCAFPRPWSRGTDLEGTPPIKRRRNVQRLKVRVLVE